MLVLPMSNARSCDGRASLRATCAGTAGICLCTLILAPHLPCMPAERVGRTIAEVGSRKWEVGQIAKGLPGGVWPEGGSPGLDGTPAAAGAWCGLGGVIL